MGISVRERADIIGTYRHLAVRLMETLARWVPTTAELEVKTLFGRHIWDLAQHGDALGRRAPDLRAALHFDLPPTAGYRTVLDDLAAVPETARRVAGFYDGILVDLAARYRQYLERTDRLLDEPTVRILERILHDYTRLQADRDAVQRERQDLTLSDRIWSERIRREAGAVSEATAFRPAPQAAEAT
jgi:hypothetical protein